LLCVLLYECEPRSVTLSEDHRLRAPENRVLRKMFGFNRKTVKETRKLRNELLRGFCLQPKFVRVFSRRMRWAGHVACVEGTRNTYRILVGRREGKRGLGRTRRR
jgi:hypothetical protein